MRHEFYKPSPHGVLIYFTAPHLDDTIAKVEGLGGRITQPKKTIGEWGSVAVIQDTEGNTVALHSAKKE